MIHPQVPVTMIQLQRRMLWYLEALVVVFPLNRNPYSYGGPESHSTLRLSGCNTLAVGSIA